MVRLLRRRLSTYKLLAVEDAAAPDFSEEILDAKAKELFEGAVKEIIMLASEDPTLLVNVFYVAMTDQAEYFTVQIPHDLDALSGNPSGLFADDVTWDSIKNSINGRSIAMVTSVTYGRVGCYTRMFKSTDYSLEIKSHVEGYKANFSMENSFKESTTQLDVDYYDYGGTGNLRSLVLANTDKSEAELLTAVGAASEKMLTESQGQPISYTIKLITGPEYNKIIQPRYDILLYEQGYKLYPNRLILNAKKTSGFGSIVGTKLANICDCSFFQVDFNAQTESIVRENAKATIREGMGATEGLEQDYMRYEIVGTDKSLSRDRYTSENVYFKNVYYRTRYQTVAGGSYSGGFGGFIDAQSFQKGKINVVIGGSQRAGGGGINLNSASTTKLDGRPNK